MQKIEVLVALLHIHNIDFTVFKTEELKVWLHSLRNITREIEREIIERERMGENVIQVEPFFVNDN